MAFPQSARQSFEQQRNKLAGIDVSQFASEIRATVCDVIDASFVDGFRLVMSVGTGLALLSAITASVLIEGHKPAKPRV